MRVVKVNVSLAALLLLFVSVVALRAVIGLFTASATRFRRWRSGR
ncbi:hypothetical protein SAURM35S_01742 [Streptomyces aurantiogriseus]